VSKRRNIRWQERRKLLTDPIWKGVTGSPAERERGENPGNNIAAPGRSHHGCGNTMCRNELR